MFLYLKGKTRYFKSYVVFHRCISRSSIEYVRSKPLKLQEVQSSNEMNSHTFERLSKAYKLLLSNKKLNNMVYDCDKLYDLEKYSLLEDLMQYPRINQDMIRYLLRGFQKSESLRQMFLSDMNNLINMKKFDVVMDVFDHMNQNGLLHKRIHSSILYIINNKEALNEDKLHSSLANLLVLQTAISGEYILASSFALKFKNIGINITESTLILVLHTLALDKNINSYNSYIIFKILKEFDLNVNLKEKIQILKYFLGDRSSPYFANIFHDNFLSENDKNELFSLKEYNDYVFDLISINFDFGNHIRAIHLWKKLHHNALKPNSTYISLTKKIIQKMIDSNDEDLKNVINILPQTGLVYEQIVDILLIYYGKYLNNKEKFELELKKLSPPLRRSTLTSLFEVFLSQNNEKAAERILQSIFKSTSGINEREFNSIVLKLINQGNIKEAMSMIKRTDSDISRLACTSILSKLLRTARTDEFMDNIIEVIGCIRKDRNGIYQESLTENVISYVSSKVSNRAARGIYSKILKLSSGNNLNIERPLHMEKYGLPDELKYFLRINKVNHIVCLRIILHQAIIDEDETTLLWSINEMRFAGMLLHDVLLELSHNSDFIEKVMKSEFYTCK